MMLVNVELTLEEVLRTISALETATTDLNERRAIRDKLAASVHRLVRDDASGEVLRHLADIDRRTKAERRTS